MASGSTFEAKVLLAKGKRAAAAYVHADCSNAANPQHLNAILENLLNPAKAIDEWETIDWCKWLMAGGRTPDEFSNTVRAYDTATTCGLVWTPNFVAYRCRTCGISPCMSLCTECFKKGNHQRHDFNMFLSQAGGACDCGDTSVMKETGFCDRHGPNKSINKGKAPSDLMCVAEAMMPRIIMRLIQHLRENSKGSTPDAHKGAIQDADAFITMLLDFNNMGGLMRKVMTSALTNPQKYRVLNEISDDDDSEYGQYMRESKRIYEEALQSLPNPTPCEDYKDCPTLQENLVHKTFLEELTFWTVKFEFPQKVVCLLLNMLPDPDYKEALTKAFVLHYSRISLILEKSSDPDTLSNRVVHVSVQLFSNESLALRMTEQLNLLHVMVISLKSMMNNILIQNTLHNPEKNFHYVVNCGMSVMREHCYWPLVSDLNNVLSHRPVALKFMSDDTILEMWFAFLSMFQGMNVNRRELNQHIEFEPNTYYAAFSAELEASAYPMWAMVSHLGDGSTAHLTRRVLSACLAALLEWLDAINFNSPDVDDSLKVSFHLPLHRYLAVFLCQAVAKQNISLNEVLPPSDTLHLLMMHPLRVQVAFYEILNGLWVRNGLQIKGQAMTYIQCNFCNSMVDADLYLLQICCTRIPAESFINIVIDKFHIKEWLRFTSYNFKRDAAVEGDQDATMLESFLTFLATLVSVRTNLGHSETSLNRLEMITLLCMGDKTHSQLMEMMPERCGTSLSRDFESLLAEVADYRAPALEACGNMQQGMYVSKPKIWEQHYDPIHVLLRAIHRRDFQTSMDRYTSYVRDLNKMKPGTSPWPPFREPKEVHSAYEDPRKILRSRVFHAVALIILYKATKGQVSEHVLALLVFLLEQAVLICDTEEETSKMCPTGPQTQRHFKYMDFTTWFSSDCLSNNLRTTIGRVILTPEPEVTPVNYSSDSDIEWEESVDNEMSDMREDASNVLMMLEGSDWGNASEQQDASGLMLYVPPSAGTESHAYDDLAYPSTSSQGNVLALPSSAGSSGMEPMETVMTVAVPESNTVETHAVANIDPGDTPMSLAAQFYALSSGANNIVRHNASWANPKPSSSTELVPAGTSGGSHRGKYPFRRKTVEGSHPPNIKINESIISLLLKLHAQFSGSVDSFNLDENVASSSGGGAEEVLIGDGPFYIGKLLNKMAALDSECRECILQTKNRLWPKKESCEEELKLQENKEREERRRRAKERQQKLMAEFASKQKQFMEKAKEEEEASADMDWKNEETTTKHEYDCVICSQTTPSTEDKPMGLVVLVQATSVIGHSRRQGTSERATLPTRDEDRENLRREDTLAAEFDRKVEELDRHFDPQSWFLSVNFGWDDGVHVQTCGHHIHLDCLNSYLRALRQQRQQSLAPEKGEYLCPLCRQLANSVLPLSPQLGDCTQMVRCRPSNMTQVLNELSDFLKENEQKPVKSKSKMAEAMGKAMDDMSSSTQLKPMFRPKSKKPSPQTLFLFVTSLARTNLEVELIQRGGSLVSTSAEPPNPLLPKRDCIVPLLHVLAAHARVLAIWPAWMTFQQLCGLPAIAPGVTALLPIEREVPLMLRDPIALLLQFILLLPLHLDQVYFTAVVKMVYNLLYYQIVTQISIGLNWGERANACDAATPGKVESLCDALALIIDCLSHTELYMGDTYQNKAQVNVVALEQQVQKLCMPFLRICTLLRHHLYNEPLPDIRSPQSEFVKLVYYLELVTEGMDWGSFNAAVALNWPADTDMDRTSPKAWCSQLEAFINRSPVAARSFLVDQHISWHQPRLLDLPREYEKIFTYYHERPCSQCHSVPPEISICLLCGTIVCLKQNCCKQQNVCEAVGHSIECGAGTGIFLVVTSTYIIVIRGHRACLWGSPYLDEFEEEDRDLKRGKPLYLNRGRYQLLEQQWLAHRFDHMKKTWVQHKNAL